MILKPLQKLPKNVEDLGKSIVAEGFKKIPKVQKIARSGHSGSMPDVNQDLRLATYLPCSSLKQSLLELSLCTITLANRVVS